LDVIKDGYSNDFIRDIWGDRRLISAGGYTRETAIAAAEEKGDLIAFARPYVANVSLMLLLLAARPPLPTASRYCKYRHHSTSAKFSDVFEASNNSKCEARLSAALDPWVIGYNAAATDLKQNTTGATNGL
jgi:hypothetical protein